MRKRQKADARLQPKCESACVTLHRALKRGYWGTNKSERVLPLRTPIMVHLGLVGEAFSSKSRNSEGRHIDEPSLATKPPASRRICFARRWKCLCQLRCLRGFRLQQKCGQLFSVLRKFGCNKESTKSGRQKSFIGRLLHPSSCSRFVVLFCQHYPTP